MRKSLRHAAALPGFAGGVHQSQAIGPVAASGPSEQSIRYWVLTGSPWPVLDSQSDGSTSGGLLGLPGPVMLPAVPSAPVFSYQQLPGLPENSSHQKSLPFGSDVFAFALPPSLLCGTSNWSSAFGNWNPFGTCPMRLS